MWHQETPRAGRGCGWPAGRPSPSSGVWQDPRPRGPTHLRCHVGWFLVVREPRSSGSGRQDGTDDLLSPEAGSRGRSCPGLPHGAWRSAARGAADASRASVLGVPGSRPPRPTSGRHALTAAGPRRLSPACPPAGLFWRRRRQQQPGPVPASRRRGAPIPEGPTVGGAGSSPASGGAAPGCAEGTVPAPGRSRQPALRALEPGAGGGGEDAGGAWWAHKTHVM